MIKRSFFVKAACICRHHFLLLGFAFVLLSFFSQAFAQEKEEASSFPVIILETTQDGPSRNGSQFFITLERNPWLNGKHTIFGQVVEGFEVLKKLEGYASYSAWPWELQRIIRAYRKN